MNFNSSQKVPFSVIGELAVNRPEILSLIDKYSGNEGISLDDILNHHGNSPFSEAEILLLLIKEYLEIGPVA